MHPTDYGRGGRGRWNRMAPRGGGMIPRDSVHPHHELDYGSPRFRGGGGISVQNGMFVRGPHIMEETYWEVVLPLNLKYVLHNNSNKSLIKWVTTVCAASASAPSDVAADFAGG
eukprot:27483-Amorphochlora_amoeboformis.AAC.1